MLPNSNGFKTQIDDHLSLDTVLISIRLSAVITLVIMALTELLKLLQNGSATDSQIRGALDKCNRRIVERDDLLLLWRKANGINS